METTTKHITKAKPAPRHIAPAQKLAYMLGKKKISERAGMAVRVVYMTETISEKTRRILAECDAVVCK